jgi:hypothetical protein
MIRGTLLVALSLASSVSAQTLTPEQRNAEGAVRIFYAGCIVYYPHPESFDDWVAGNRFEVVPPEFARTFVQAPGARAFSIHDGDWRYTLVAEPSNLCTVYVKELNLEYTRAPLAKARKRLVETGLRESSTVRTAKRDGVVMTTTEYQYKDKAGAIAWTLIVSETTSSAGRFQLAMSASSKLRAGKTAAPAAAPKRP